MDELLFVAPCGALAHQTSAAGLPQRGAEIARSFALFRVAETIEKALERLFDDR